MNQTFFKRAPSCYSHCLWCFWKANALFVMLSFSFVYGECCMLLSGVCFFLFVMRCQRDWSSSWESRSIPCKNLKFSISKANRFLPLHILFEPNQHMITKFTFMICTIWWVAYSNTPNLSNLIHWSNLDIVLYFSSYAIATTLTLCSHSCLWY
jgi:hypothetical protein